MNIKRSILKRVKRLLSIKKRYNFEKEFLKIPKSFEFENPKTPKVSIIIPVYNQYKYTIACLWSILNNTKDIDYEIIIADDNSNDETKDIQNVVKGLNVLRNTENKGYLLNVNSATKEARGEYLVLMNNDIIVKEKWLDALLYTMVEDEEIGYVGGKCIGKNGLILEAGCKVEESTYTSFCYLNELINNKQANIYKEVDYCSAACVLIRKDIWNKLNGYDERFKPGYYEDVDLCFRIKYELELKIVYQPKCEVYHFHGITHKKNVESMVQKNRKIFRAKWKQILDLNKKRNILIDANLLCNYFAENKKSRTGIFFVLYNLIIELSKKESLNIYLYLNYENIPSILELKEKDHRFDNLKIFDGNLDKMDIFFSPYEKIPDIIKNNGIRCFTFIHDLTPLLFKNYNDENLPFFYMIKSLTKDDFLFANSEYTKQDFIKNIKTINPQNITTTYLAASESFYPDKNLEKNKELRKKYNIPFDKKYVFSLCTLEPRKNLITTVECFIEFINKNNIDDLVFVLGGSHWDEFINILEEKIKTFSKDKNKIIKAGYIDDEDLSNLYSNAQFMAYLSFFEGFGLPVLEAMQCGCPVISSNKTSLPEVVSNAGVLVNPKNKNEIISAFETLYYDDDIRLKYSQKGIERASNFSWEKCATEMEEEFLNVPLNNDRKSLILIYKKKVGPFSIISKIEEKIFYIFKLPILKIKRENYKTRYFLFGFLRVFKTCEKR